MDDMDQMIREEMLADGYADLACQRQESTDAMTEHLGVHDNETGPGFYVGDLDDPESMEHTFDENDAYDILEEMKEEYFNNNI